MNYCDSGPSLEREDIIIEKDWWVANGNNKLEFVSKAWRLALRLLLDVDVLVSLWAFDLAKEYISLA